MVDNQPFRCDLRVFDILDREIAHVTDLRQIFGRGSNGDLAVKVINNIPREAYDALRTKAVELGLVDVRRERSLFPMDREPTPFRKY